MDTDTKEKNLNPAEADTRQKFGPDERPGSIDMSSFESRGVAEPDRRGHVRPESLGAARNQAGEAEKQAMSDTAVGKAASTAASTVNPVLGQAVKFLGKIKTKKGGVVAGVISLLMVAIIAIGSFMTLSLAPVAFFTNVLDDLNDSVAALDDRKIGLMRAKTAFKDTDKVMKGCGTKMSIRCKYRSLSSKDVAQMEKAGIIVEGKSIGGRTFPSQYRIGTDTYNPRELADAIRNKPDVSTKFRTAFNMRFYSTVSGNFKAVLAKFRTSAKAASATGDNAEERFRNLSETGLKESLPPDAKLVPADGEDPDNPTKWVVEGGDPTVTYDQAQKDLIEQMRNFGDVGFKSGFMKSISATGWADTACTFKNMIGFTAQVSKVYQKRHLIQAAMPIAALAFKLKAGQATMEDTEAIGDYFTRADSRQKVDDVTGTVTSNPDAFQEEGVENGADVVIQQKDNEFYKKNATDGTLARMSMYGGDFKPTETTVKYSLSMSDSMLVTGLAGTAAALEKISSIGTGTDTCDYIQSWWARGIGLIGGIFAAFGSAGTTVLFNIGVMAVAALGMMVLQEKLIGMVSGSPLPEDIAQKPEDRQAIQWTGMAGLMDEAAMRNGLVPGSPDAVLAYQQRSLPTKQEYIALEAQNSAWNDLSTPYSILGQLVVQKDKFSPDSSTIPSYLASIGSLLSTATEYAFNRNALAETLDADRLKFCDDEVYKTAGPGGEGGTPIAVDVQCNVRYHFPEEDAALDSDDVAAWMEDQGYVPVDTDDGLPKGYIQPNENEVSGFIDSIVSGAVNDFYNTRSSMYRIDGKINHYAIYLDYCVHRSMPWGNTFEENGAFGGVEDGWINGSNCMLRDGQDGDGINGSTVKYFRAYTVSNSAVNINEDYTPPKAYFTETSGVSDGQPPNTISHGSMGWSLKENVDYYTDYPCEGGMADEGKYTHPTRGFSIRKCRAPGNDDVSSLISGRLAALQKKAEDQGISLIVYSGFRTYEEQAATYAANCNPYTGVCDPPTALPGDSNHEQGLSVDFNNMCWPNATCSPGTNEGYDFLMENAATYGFLKHPREAWHWGTRTYQ